jgi:hypothetical protein
MASVEERKDLGEGRLLPWGRGAKWPATRMLLDLNTELKGESWTNNRGIQIEPRTFWDYRPLSVEAGRPTGDAKMFAPGISLPLTEQAVIADDVETIRPVAPGLAETLAAQLGTEVARVKSLCPVFDTEPLLVLPEQPDRPLTLRDFHKLESGKWTESRIRSKEFGDQILLAYDIRRAQEGDAGSISRLVACYDSSLRRVVQSLARHRQAVALSLDEPDLMPADKTLYSVGQVVVAKLITGDSRDDVIRAMRHVIDKVPPRARIGLQKEIVSYAVSLSLGQEEKRDRPRKSPGYFQQLTSDPELWLLTLNAGARVAELWTRCVLLRTASVLWARTMWESRDPADRSGSGGSLLNPFTMWLLNSDTASCVVAEPEFNSQRYHPALAGNLTDFLFGTAPGRPPRVKTRLRDYLRIRAGAAGLGTRRPVAENWGIRAGEVEQLGDDSEFMAVEAVESLQDLDEAAKVLLEVLPNDELDRTLLGLKIANPELTRAQLSEALGIGEVEIQKRLDAMWRRSEQHR